MMRGRRRKGGVVNYDLRRSSVVSRRGQGSRGVAKASFEANGWQERAEQKIRLVSYNRRRSGEPTKLVVVAR